MCGRRPTVLACLGGEKDPFDHLRDQLRRVGLLHWPGRFHNLKMGLGLQKPTVQGTFRLTLHTAL